MLMEWILSASVLTAAVLLLRLVFRRRISQKLQYWLWLPVLLRLLIPVPLFHTSYSVAGAAEHLAPAVFSAPAPASTARPVTTAPPVTSAPAPQSTPRPAATAPAGTPAPALTAAPAPVATASPEPVQPKSLNVRQLLTRLWLAGSLAAGLWLLGVNLRFAQRLRLSRRELMQRKLPVYVSAEAASPCLFGLRNPAIYLTEACAEGGKAQREQVLLHEETHYKQMDHIWGSLRCLCLAVWWWNPLVWLASVCSRRDGELSCDEKVMELLGEDQRLDYARTLVALLPAKAPRPMLSAATLSGGGRAMKQRLERIVKKPKAWVLAAAVVLLLALAAVGCAFAGRPEETPAPVPGSASAADPGEEGLPGSEALVPTDYGVYTEEGFLDLRAGQRVYDASALQGAALEFAVIDRSELPVLYLGPGLQLWRNGGWAELTRRPGFELSREGKRIEGGETLFETVDPAAFEEALEPGRYRLWLSYSVGGDPRAPYDWTVYTEFEIAEGASPAPAPGESAELLLGSAKPEKVKGIEYRLNVYDHYFLDRGDMGFDTALDLIFSLRGAPCEKPQGLLVSRSFTLDGVPDISLAFDGERVYANRFGDRWYLLDAGGRPDQDLTDVFLHWGRGEETPEIRTLPAAYQNRIEDGSLTVETLSPVFDLAVMRASLEQLRVLYRDRGEEPPELVRELMVTVRVTNHTEKAIDVPYDMGLEALRDGEWQFIPWREGLMSGLMAYSLGAGEEISGLGIPMLNYYEEALTPGRYRVCLPYRLRLDKGGSEHVAYAEFEIVDGPQPEKVYIPIWQDYPATESRRAYLLSFRVPAGWRSVELSPEEAAQQGLLYLYNGTEDRHFLRDGQGNIVGAFGCMPYGEVPGEESDPRAVYSQIAIGNGYRFDVQDSYTRVSEREFGENARVDVLYSQSFLRPFLEEAQEKRNEGFLSYDRALGVYAAVELEPGALTEEEMDTLARSLHIEQEEPGPAPVTKQEILAAYEAAREAFRWFEVSSLDDLPADRTDVREEGFQRYYLITDPRFASWDTLEAYLLSLFDDETVRARLSSGPFKEFDGRVYGFSADAGTDQTLGDLVGIRVNSAGEDRYVVSADYARLEPIMLNGESTGTTQVGFSSYDFPYVWQGDRWAFEGFRLVETDPGPLPEPGPSAFEPLTEAEGTDWLPLSYGARRLTSEELADWKAWFDADWMRSQFLTSAYARPEDVDLRALFYNGVDIWEETRTDYNVNGRNPVTKEDVRYLLLHLGFWHTETDSDKLPRSQVDAVLQKYLGLGLDETAQVNFEEGSFPYIPETDSFYHMHGDTNAVFLSGFLGGYAFGEEISLFYGGSCPYYGPQFTHGFDYLTGVYRVKLRRTGEGVHFVSNLRMLTDGVNWTCEEPMPGPAVPADYSGDFGVDVTVLTPEPTVFGSYEEAMEATEGFVCRIGEEEYPIEIGLSEDYPGYGTLVYGAVSAGLPHGPLTYFWFVTRDGRRYDLPRPVAGLSEAPLDISDKRFELADEGRAVCLDNLVPDSVRWQIRSKGEMNPAPGILPKGDGSLSYILYLPTMEVIIWFRPEE